MPVPWHLPHPISAMHRLAEIVDVFFEFGHVQSYHTCTIGAVTLSQTILFGHSPKFNTMRA